MGTWKNKKPHGYGDIYYKDGYFNIGHFEKGIKHVFFIEKL